MHEPVLSPAVDAAHRAADRADWAGYAVAAAVLLIGGPILRTPVLNWISGPAIVVTSVVVVGMLRDRRPASSDPRSSDPRSSDPRTSDPAHHDPGTPPAGGGDR